MNASINSIEQTLSMTTLENNNNTNVEIHDDFYVSFANQNSQRRNSIEDSVMAEITRYMADDRKMIAMLNAYPLIKNVYMRSNTTLSASAPIERVFSRSKLVSDFSETEQQVTILNVLYC